MRLVSRLSPSGCKDARKLSCRAIYSASVHFPTGKKAITATPCGRRGPASIGFRAWLPGLADTEKLGYPHAIASRLHRLDTPQTAAGTGNDPTFRRRPMGSAADREIRERVEALERFRFSRNTRTALTLCFHAIPDGKPLHTFPGVALAGCRFVVLVPDQRRRPVPSLATSLPAL